MNQSKKAVDKIRNSLGTSTATGQLLIGTVSGLVTGYVTRRIGRTVSFATGTGIIAFQLAQSKGLVNITWEQLREKAENARKDKKTATAQTKGCEMWNKVKSFSQKNTPFAAGFIGGFLIGVA